MFKVPLQLAPPQQQQQRDHASSGSFLEDLQRFLASIGQRIPSVNPSLNGRPLQLALLFESVINRGGWQRVNVQNGWEKISYILGVPKPCANAGHALKAIYHQYLLKYECAKFNRSISEDTEEEDIYRRTGSFGTNHGKVPDYLRVSAGLSTDLREEDNFEKLRLSLSCGLPNEVDFAVNSLLIRSADRRPLFLTSAHLPLVEALMASVGLFSNHSGHYIGVYNAFRRESGKDLLRFWKTTVTEPEFLNWLQVEGKVQPDTDACEPDVIFSESSEAASLESTGMRIKQTATILYNLAFEEANAAFLAENNSCLKFAFMCAKCSKAQVLELGLDMMIALAAKIDVTMCEPWVLQALTQTIRSCITSADRLSVLQGLMLISKVCDMDKNADNVIDGLEEADYLRLAQYLSIPDTPLIIFSLEALYKLSGLGERQSTHIAEVPELVTFLVKLMSVSVETIITVESSAVVENMVPNQPQIIPVPVPVSVIPPAPTLSTEEVEATVGWLNRAFEVEDTFAMTMTDVFREYVLFCASTKKFQPGPQSLMHCLRIAFPQGRTTNLNIGGKSQLCLLGCKKRGDAVAAVLSGHVTAEAQHNSATSANAAPVLASMISSHDSSKNHSHSPSLPNGIVTNKTPENSTLIRSLLATKINRKHSSESLLPPQNTPPAACNGVAEGTATDKSSVGSTVKKPRKKKEQMVEFHANGIGNGGPHLFSDDSQSSSGGPAMPVPYVEPIKIKKPRGRPRLNGPGKRPTMEQNNGNDKVGSPLATEETPPAKPRKSTRRSKTKASDIVADLNGHLNGGSVSTPETPIAKKTRTVKKRKAAGDEEDNISVSSLASQSTVASIQTSGNPTATQSSRMSSPSGSVNEVLDFLCEWDGCQRLFGDANSVFRHSCVEHVPSALEGVCKWPNCNGIKRATLSLITHLSESHCSQNELIRQSVRRRDIRRGIPTTIPPPAAQPLPNYSEHAALHSIQARYGTAVASDFAPESESQSTKTTRLTAALILRNIAHFSHVGRIRLERYENCLTNCAMQISEASQVVNECLFYLSVHRRNDEQSAQRE